MSSLIKKIYLFYRRLFCRKGAKADLSNRDSFRKRRRIDFARPEVITFIRYRIGTSPNNLSLFEQAFTHRSYPKTTTLESNERLEFLGDAVLNTVVSRLLFDRYTNEDEGQLSKMRSSLVNRNQLNHTASTIGIDKLLKVAPNMNIHKKDILGNAYEALIGAIYLDLGLTVCQEFIEKTLFVTKDNLVDKILTETDYKTEFIVMMQKEKLPFEFDTTSNFEEKEKKYIHSCTLLFGSRSTPLSTGVGNSKKEAHQKAAKEALELIKNDPHCLEHFR